ncbi:hypothetical protein RUM43_000566 [Polyplax serrata]|uniref:Uncharacterized protein n=1 Tax=Polyplax serrata TaxID=468196 RepID=A0AAN8SE51_POLSC
MAPTLSPAVYPTVKAAMIDGFSSFRAHQSRGETFSPSRMRRTGAKDVKLELISFGSFPRINHLIRVDDGWRTFNGLSSEVKFFFCSKRKVLKGHEKSMNNEPFRARAALSVRSRGSIPTANCTSPQLTPEAFSFLFSR